MEKLVAMFALALVSIGLFACGEQADDSTSTPNAAGSTATTAPTKTELPLLDDRIGDEHIRYSASADGELAYTVSEASASPGKDRLQFVNPQHVRHNVVIEGPNGGTIGKTKTIGRGITSAEVVLKPGVYVVYCSVPGHRKAGMEGHLTVYNNK